MKYNILIILFFSFFLISLSSNNVNASLPLIGKVIVIDPGHGGKDPGTVKNKIYEKDINLKISKYLEEELIKLGASIILTRDGDYDLSSPGVSMRKKSDFDNRIKIINSNKVNLYLSIHLNYLNDSNYFGPQVFYNKDNEKLALILQKELNNELKTNREIKEIPKSTYMYSKLNKKGVLIECGFLSNANELNKLITEDYQKKIATVIANSIVKYY